MTKEEFHLWKPSSLLESEAIDMSWTMTQNKIDLINSILNEFPNWTYQTYLEVLDALEIFSEKELTFFCYLVGLKVEGKIIPKYYNRITQ